MMKRFFELVLCLQVFFAFFLTSVTGLAAKRMIAVTDVSSRVRGWEGVLVAREFDNAVTSVLGNSGLFTVVERRDLDHVIREHGIEQSGLVDDNTALQMGKLSGAELTFVASVIAASVSRVDNFLYDSVKAKAKIAYKIIDNATGEIKISDVVEGNSSMLQSNRPEPKLLLANAAKEAVNKLSKRFEKLNLLVGNVMKAGKEEVYVNLGTEHGVKVGDIFEVFTEGESLIDPVTGNLYGVTEEKAGTMKVIKVFDMYSIMKPKKIKGKLDNKCKVRRKAK